jgi:hypothetical protein
MLRDHPLAGLIAAPAAGRFPAADGGWRRVPPWRPGLEAIISFTGHAVFAVRPDLAGHPRAEFAAGIRDHPRIVGYQDPGRSALAVISTGIAGRTELRPSPGGHTIACRASCLLAAKILEEKHAYRVFFFRQEKGFQDHFVSWPTRYGQTPHGHAWVS